MTAPTAALRDAIRWLLDPSAPEDAVASYYALYHDPYRTELFVTPEGTNRPAGFLVRARTGYDLFRPVVTLRAADEESAVDLFRRGLVPGRPVLLFVPERLAELAVRRLEMSQAERLHLYVLEPFSYQPVINVLVTRNLAPGSLPRYEIRSGDQVVASAGLNWRSSEFGEVYVQVDPVGRQRGWGKSVASALAGELLQDRVRPLYLAAERNLASIRLATSLGFRDTGFREFTGQAVYYG